MDKVDLVVVVPTWNRMTNCWRLADAFKRTSRARALLMFVVSGDTPAQLALFTDIANVSPGCVYAPYPGPAGEGVTAPLNYGAAIAAATYDPVAIGYMGDDHLPRTVGWDAMYLEALGHLKDGAGFVHGDDLIQGSQLATEVTMSTEVYRALGYFGQPTLPHLYVDNAWTELANFSGKLAYLESVVMEHMHHTARLAAVDDTYGPGLYEGEATASAARQRAAYEHWRSGGGRQRDLDRLAKLWNWPAHG